MKHREFAYGEGSIMEIELIWLNVGEIDRNQFVEVTGTQVKNLIIEDEDFSDKISLLLSKTYRNFEHFSVQHCIDDAILRMTYANWRIPGTDTTTEH